MSNQKTAVMLIGFGGPNGMEEVRPFLDSILRGAKIPEERLVEVVRHYEVFQGRSPYNEQVDRQRSALETWLKDHGMPIPVFVGLRHSSPSFKETFLELKKLGIQKVIGFVLSAFRSYASYEKYIERLEEGQREADALEIKAEYTGPFFENPLFIEAQSDKIVQVLQKLDIDKTYFLFSAHSIPTAMSDKSGYPDQFKKTAFLIASQLKLEHWGLGYQSRSGNPREPWLGPDVKEAIAGLDKKQFKNVVLIPVGFVCENIEILYDLDTDVKSFCEKSGFAYKRAGTVADHPAFIKMIGKQIGCVLTVATPREDQFLLEST